MSVAHEALAMIRRLAPEGGQDEIQLLGDLGRVLRAQGDLAGAEAALRRALELGGDPNRVSDKARSKSEMARTLCALGRVYADHGDYAIAKRLYFQALEMAADAKDKAELYDQLTDVLILLGEKQRAWSFAQSAYDIFRNLYPASDFPRGHPDLATSLVRLAEIVGRETTFGFSTDSRGVLRPGPGKVVDDDQSGDLYRRALEMFQALLPEKEYPYGTVEYSDCLWKLGQWHLKHRRLEQAEDFCRRSVKMLEGLFPTNEYPDGHPPAGRSPHRDGSFPHRAGSPRLDPTYGPWPRQCPPVGGAPRFEDRVREG
jgi:tetratricopeptide (TPR) repeat protein